MDYETVYEKLYENGYEAGHDESHGVRSGFAARCLRLPKVEEVLDIGCAHGPALEWFEAKGIEATGLDVSQLAVSLATSNGLDAYHGCATSLPFADEQFDLVFSSDTFEHLEPDDVDKAIAEAFRVARRYVAVQIACRPDRASWKEIVGHDLHLTVQSPYWWRDQFQARGEVLYFRPTRGSVEIIVSAESDRD